MMYRILCVIFCSLFVFGMGETTVWAVNPPTVEPSPKGDSKNKNDAAIVIGNENYRQMPQAIYAVNDAIAISGFLKNTRLVTKSKMTQLNNAKKSDIEKALSKYSKKTNKNGTLWIYFAGHGYTDSDGNRYILPIDADPSDLKANAIELNYIFEQTGKRGNKVILIVDSSFGKKGRDGLDVYNGPNNQPYGIANNDPDEILWIADSGTYGNPAYIQAQHSLFTYLILGGVQGWADGELDNKPDGTITMGELQEFVAHKMLQLGQDAESSVFDNPEVRDWEVHSSTSLQPSPNDAIFEELSISIRMRNFANQAELLRAEATTIWNDVLFDVQKGGPQGEEALQRFLQEYEKTTIRMDWLVYIPQVSQARQMLRDYNNLGNIVAFDPEICKDVQGLEPLAIVGQLTPEHMACLDAQLRLERLQTQRSKISLLLINNDFNKKDWKSWEFRMRNHLGSIDRSEPDLSLGFAIYLQNKGPEYYKEALYWSNYALETRSNWPEGDTFVQKSNKLYKLRAQLAMELWVSAEKAYTAERTPELDQLSKEARGLAKDLAREWLDYTKQANIESSKDQAFNLCMSTSPDPEFCKE